MSYAKREREMEIVGVLFQKFELNLSLKLLTKSNVSRKTSFQISNLEIKRFNGFLFVHFLQFISNIMENINMGINLLKNT